MVIILFLLVSAVGVSSWIIWRRRTADGRRTRERRPVITGTTSENSVSTFTRHDEPIKSESDHKSREISASSVGGDASEFSKGLGPEENGKQAQLPINVTAESESTEPHLPSKTDAEVGTAEVQSRASGELPAANSVPEFFPDLVEAAVEQHEPPVTGTEEVMAEVPVAEPLVAPAKPPETRSSLRPDDAPVGTTLAVSTDSSDGQLVVAIPTGQLGTAGAPEGNEESEEAPQRYRPPVQKPPQ